MASQVRVPPLTGLIYFFCRSPRVKQSPLLTLKVLFATIVILDANSKGYQTYYTPDATIQIKCSRTGRNTL